MLKDILSKFKKDPLGLIKRSLYRTLIGPIKYGKGNDYDAHKYWHNRFSKYGLSLKGAGDEGLSEEENKKRYTEAAKVFTDLCQRESIDFQSVRVLEIGCGTGFYTQLLHNLGVEDYVGVDITDVLFPELRKKIPQFRFVRKDFTLDKIEGKFDLVIMIDVIEHIVKEANLSFAMQNVKNCLSHNGVFIVSPIMDVSKKHLFYLRFWSLEDIKRRFPGYIFRELVPFRGGHVLIIRKP
jgi:2-polyprenyl-3-methyl-5-hydroxy-6-metoxy-1,4-benzoquinol methylase